jgi:hypothetical protein
MDFDAPFVHILKLWAAANALVRAEIRQEKLRALLAGDRQALPAFGAAAFQHQSAVLGAHTHEKPMRLLAMTRVGLKSPNSLSHDIPSA